MLIKRYLILFFIIILLGFFLRVYNLDGESFWIDEGATALVMERYDGIGILKNIYFHDNALPEVYDEPGELPVYLFTLNYWARLFGITEISLRLFSVLFDILTLIFIFLLAKLLFGKNTALLSSFIYALSIPAIEFSQEARSYAFLSFFTIASMYFLIVALKNNKNYYWVTYAVLSILGLYTHYLYELIVVFQVFYILFYLVMYEKNSIRTIVKNFLKNDLLKKIFVTFLIILIVSLPLIPRTFRDENIEPWWTKPTLEKTAKVFIHFATWIYPPEESREAIKNGQFFKLNFQDKLLFLSVAFTAILTYILIFYLFFSKIRRTSFRQFLSKERGIVLLVGWFGFPILIALIVSLITPANLFGPFRYVFYSLPAFIMLVSYGMLQLKPIYFKTFFLIFVFLNILPLQAYYTNVDKQQWREVAAYMKDKVTDEDVIIISLHSGEAAFKYYFGDSNNIHGVRKLDGRVIDLIRDKESLWLILTFLKYSDPERTIQNYVNKNYKLIESKQFFDIEVYHYKKDK